MLGYRSLFDVPDNPQLLTLTLGQLYSWLKAPPKRYDADALVEGIVCNLARSVRGVLLRHATQDGSESVRARISEETRQGDWITELTAHRGAKPNTSWVLVEISGPRPAGVPNLTRNLLDVLQGRDGPAVLSTTPTILRPDEVAQLVETLEDPRRRALSFVAGTAPDFPMDRWSSMVANLLHQTTGHATMFLLDPSATTEFRNIVGPAHAVAPGTLRTFAPETRFQDPSDSVRHRVLTTQRILREDTAHVRKLLGTRARDVALARPLPSIVRRTDAAFRSQLDDIILRPVAISVTEKAIIPTEATELPTEVTDQLSLSDTVATIVVPDVAQDDEASLAYAEFLTLITEVTGEAVVTVDSIQNLRSSLREVRAQAQALSAARMRLERIEATVTELQTSVENGQLKLDDEQVERRLAEDERLDAQRTVRYLQQVLVSSGQAATAWDAPSTPDTYPESFEDLVDRIDELDYVVFTGDPEVTINLESHDPLGTWARKAWEVCLVLEDYAAASLAGRCPRDVHGYLRNVPSGCRGYSANQHTPKESAGTENNPRFAQPRTLRVPSNVSPSGTIYMEAHFKIALSRMISPRLHYFDDTARSGKVYVGYIGPHLPTGSTN